jgi:hypothetical protein
MLSGIKPLTITKRQAKELLPPKLVDRLIYAAKNFPEIGWLEILPKEEGKEVRETYIVYESLERAFQRIRAGEYPPDFPSDYQGPKEAPGAKIGRLILALKPANRRLVSTTLGRPRLCASSRSQETEKPFDRR